MMRLIFSRTDSGILFIALTLGYMVLYFAKRETGWLKKIGYFIGIIAILANGVLLLGKLSLRLNTCSRNNTAFKQMMHNMK